MEQKSTVKSSGLKKQKSTYKTAEKALYKMIGLKYEK